MRRKFAGALLAATLACAGAGASAQTRAPGWHQLGQAEQAILSPLAADWDSFDAERRRKWLDLAARYPSMTVEEQSRMRARMSYWGSLTAQERIEARERYKRLQAMPADQRETLRRQWEAYEGLSPEERSRLGAAQRPGSKAPGAAAAAPVRK
ncbi:DUF3106 domain-containing protein [Methyloversatilis discipulorum]|uniref:DUF3106 domain-containing protein n=1 Tax=Methyloversatilis discipulorum TaxID=1119528 RepID=UPI003137E7D5